MNVYHLETKQTKMERLTEWVSAQGQWAADYVEHEDNINNYAEVLHHGDGDIFLNNFDEDIRDLVKNNVELALWHSEPELIKDFYRRDNELVSINIGEIETELTGIMRDDIECVFTHLCKGLTDEEIQESCDKTDYYRSGDYIYDDFSYWRVGLFLQVDDFLKAIKEEKE